MEHVRSVKAENPVFGSKSGTLQSQVLLVVLLLLEVVELKLVRLRHSS
jgi:hypothetical protein